MIRTIADGIKVFPLALDGEAFGWTSDEGTSHAVLDAYAAAGGNFVDTADSYSAGAPGHSGGESETIIGRWLAARRNRDQVVLGTKVGRHPRFPGLSADNIRAAADASLARLQTDYLDVYYAHVEDPAVPIEETAGAFDELVKTGKVHAVGLSGYHAGRIRAWLGVARDNGYVLPTVIQPHYNLVRRDDDERDIAATAEQEQLAVVPYFSSSSGFMAGPARPEPANGDPPRAAPGSAYFSHAGLWAFDALETIALARRVRPAAVALAWLRTRPGVAAPVVKARTPEQLPDLLAATTLDLDADERAALDEIADTPLDD